MNIQPVTRFANRNALKLKKHSPQILFVAGIVGTVATTVLASRATLKAVPVVEELKAERENLEDLVGKDIIKREDFQSEVIQQYAHTTIELTKLYGPVVIIGVGSIAALTKSHRQLTNRNQALTVAFTGLYETFNRYRERVREELGGEIDQQFLHGTVIETREIEGKNGKVTTKDVTLLDPNSAAALSYYFDASLASWHSAPGYNQTFLEGQRTWANIKLKEQGHLFLNDVYDLLKIPRTREGAILGWVYKDLGNNDMFVSFGEFDGEFVAGYKPDVMLNFNIHGPILDLI